MKRLILLLLLPTLAFGAALPSTTVWEANTSATSANANAGGFDIASAGLPTDLACTVGNTTTPDCTSATIGTWPSGVDSKWLWISGASGANWNINGKNDASATTGGGCYFPITAHSTTHITVNAAIGAGVCLYDANAINVTAPNIVQHWVLNTVAGVGVASPSTGTFGIDYSQATAAVVASNATLGSTSGANTTLTSTAAFDVTMVHNFVHITTTGTGAHCVVGFYEITAFTSSSAVTTNATTNDGTNCVAGTGSVGGALSFGTATDGTVLSTTVAGNAIWIKSGTFTEGANTTVTTVGSAASPLVYIGYNAIRSDAPTDSTRPTFNMQGFIFTPSGTFQRISNVIFTGTSSTNGVLGSMGNGGTVTNVKAVNTSTTAAGIALRAGSGEAVINSEAISYRGIAVSTAGGSVQMVGCYIHDSDTGISFASGSNTISYSIIADNVSFAATSTLASAQNLFINDTLYGAENKLGTGVSWFTGTGTNRLMDTIIYGFVTGVTHADVQQGGFDSYNDYFNNTTDVTNWQKGVGDLALTPGFISVAQTTGTGASSSTNVLTDSAAHFNSVSPVIVNNQDFVYVSAGTGTGIALVKYLITSHTDTTLTLSSNITSAGSGSAIAYQLTTGHNFAIGANLKAGGWPGLFPPGLTTGYLDIGAVQRKEASSQHAFGFQR